MGREMELEDRAAGERTRPLMFYVYLTDAREAWANIVNTLQMCEALSEAYDVTFFHPWAQARTVCERLCFFGVQPTFRIVRLLATGPLKKLWLDYANRIFFFAQTWLYAFVNQPEFIYTRDFSFMVFVALLPKSLRPTGIIIYEPHKLYHRVSTRVREREFEAKAIAAADVIIPISHGVRRDLLELGVNPGRMCVAPCGVKLANFERPCDTTSLRERWGISPDEVTIVYAGAWEDWKGVDVLLRAFQHVAQCVAECRLLLVGVPPQVLDRGRTFLGELGIDPARTLMRGYVEQAQVIEFLRASQIGVVPNLKTVLGSRYSSPLKLFEYMAAGLAVVASDLPSIREVISEREALFFESENSADLADKLIILIRDRSLREKLAGRSRVKADEYSHAHRCQLIQQAIQQVVVV
jgi:glycosyltransferase involved in cell wall biosynthesis